MKIEFSDHHIPVLLAALEAFERFRINQPKTALEQIFPKECLELGWSKVAEICSPFQKAFFPDDSANSGPSICSEKAGDARISYEIQKTIKQYMVLKKTGGWFESGYDFDGNLLNPSGLPPPKIEGLDEMQYKVFLIPDQSAANIEALYDNGEYQKIWDYVDVNMNLPHGGKMEITESEKSSLIRHFYVKVYKPRKPLDDKTF